MHFPKNLMPMYSPEQSLPQTQAMLQDAIKEGVFVGGVVAAWNANSESAPLFIEYAGQTHSDAEKSSPVGIHTVFDLASMTKALFTTVLTGILVDRKWLDWESPIQKFFLQATHLKNIKIRHLLAHTAGFEAWRPFYESLRIELKIRHSLENERSIFKVSVQERQTLMRELVLAVEPQVAVDKRALYSDLSFLILGFVLEDALQMPLDQAFQSMIISPMELGCFFKRTTKDPRTDFKKNIAATEDCPWRGAILQGQVHDDNTWAMGGYAGHAGAFGSVLDVVRLQHRLYQGFLSLETTKKMWTRVQLPSGCSRTLGWDTTDPQSNAGSLASPFTVGHLGYTGTSIWFNTQSGWNIALLTNRVHPTRENIKIRAFRPKIHDCLMKEVIEISK